MRIVFDVSSCAKSRRVGIGNYGAELIKGLTRIAPQHELVLAVRPNRWTKRALVDDLLPGTRVRVLFDRLHGLTLGRPIDVLHGVGIRLPAGGSYPKVVMMHDVNVFEFPELSTDHWRETRQARIRQTVARADRMIVYSKQGASALCEHLDISPERVRIVPLGVDVQRFRPRSRDELRPLLQRHDLTGRPFVLLVGSYDGRKNHGGLLRAFARADLPDAWVLVLGGPRGDDGEAIRSEAERLGLPADRLRLPGWVSDEELPLLIAGAEIYCCASFHEGFGLPVIEAQACGTAVASSDRAALPETLGDCGLSFDPGDEDGFATTLAKLAADGALRADFAARGPARIAAHYSWDRVAADTLAVFEEFAPGGRG
jgi:alpha-1,3-rhamnosyl/mannosyltransferase